MSMAKKQQLPASPLAHVTEEIIEENELKNGSPSAAEYEPKHAGAHGRSGADFGSSKVCRFVAMRAPRLAL
jgi:hypothetical protein